MNDKELDDMDASKTFTKQPNRVTRVACGAGVMEIEVHALLDQYKKFSQVVKQMGGVKELFKDEKQIKNLNPAKMGKVISVKTIISVKSHKKYFLRFTRVWPRPWIPTCCEPSAACGA